MSALDDAFRDNILDLTEGLFVHTRNSDPVTINEEFDAIADAHSPWSWLKRVNFALMRRIIPTKRAALVATVRNEGIGLIEWIAHHRAVGFERIFIYTNDNTDGSDELLRALHAHGIIHLIINKFTPGTPVQIKAYEHSIHLLRELRDYEWVAYLDADEFLIPDIDHGFDVKNLIAAIHNVFTTKPPHAICLNWMFMGSDGHVKRSSGLVQERFLTGSYHDHVKSIVHLQDISTMWAVHIPDPNRAWFIDGNFATSVMTACSTTPTYRHGMIKHFYEKSYEEYMIKVARNVNAGEHFIGKDASQFFGWDLDPATSTKYPTHEILLNKTKKEIATLLELQGIAQISRSIENHYNNLSKTRLGGDLKAIFEKSRRLFQKDRIPS